MRGSRWIAAAIIVSALAFVEHNATRETGPDWGVCAMPVEGEGGPDLERLIGLNPLPLGEDATVTGVELLDAQGMSLIGAWLVPVVRTSDGSSGTFGTDTYPPTPFDDEFGDALLASWEQRAELPADPAAVASDPELGSSLIIAVRREGDQEAIARGVRAAYRSGWWPLTRHHGINVEIRLSDTCADPDAD